MAGALNCCRQPAGPPAADMHGLGGHRVDTGWTQGGHRVDTGWSVDTGWTLLIVSPYIVTLLSTSSQLGVRSSALTPVAPDGVRYSVVAMCGKFDG